MSTHLPRRLFGATLLAAAAGFALAVRRTHGAEVAVQIPVAALDETPGGTEPAVAVLAGGCFWGVQAVFQRTEGVLNAVSGYAGGQKPDAKYGIVSRGKTQHAEAVQITYDPAKITYGKLLRIFFSVAHDPTQLNRQGPDVGPQYRSAIFPMNEEQAHVARAYISQLDGAKVFGAAIVTKVERSKTFHKAEEYHQDYLVKNPREPYILYNDMPKLAELKRVFPEVWREKPVLVGAPRRLGLHGNGSEAFYQGLPGKN
jgi:peptide-methionine (S)-S-oxide reductase